MAFPHTVQPASAPASPTSPHSFDALTPVLATALLAAYGVSKSKKGLRKMKRRMMGAVLKEKLKSFFSGKREGISTRTLIYILLAVAFLALLAISPLYALIVAVIALILILAKVV